MLAIYESLRRPFAYLTSFLQAASKEGSAPLSSHQLTVIEDDTTESETDSELAEVLSLPDFSTYDRMDDCSPLPLALLSSYSSCGAPTARVLHPLHLKFLPPFSPTLTRHSSEFGIATRCNQQNSLQFQSRFSSQLMLEGPTTSIQSPSELLLLPPVHRSPFNFSFGSSSLQGVPRYNEDAFFTQMNGTVLWWGIFDGHGGDEVSNYLAENLSQHLQMEDPDLPSIIQQMEEEIEQQYIQEWSEVGRDPGSTLLVGSVSPDGCLTVANCGDCRLLLISQVSDSFGNKTAFVSRTTQDHSIGNLAEESRMKAELAAKWNTGFHPLPSAFENGRIAALEVSRSIGDFGSKAMLPSQVIISTPEMYRWKLGQDDLLVVAVSDGISAVLDDTEICNHVCRSLNDAKHLNDMGKAASDLASYAISVAGSEDNCTSVIVSLHANRPPPAPSRRRLFGRK